MKKSLSKPSKKPVKRLKLDSSFLKIGPAAKTLGVSIDTLRRWEKSGKITAERTPGGTRLYHLSTLKKINPVSVEDFQTKGQTTEELLNRIQKDSEGLREPADQSIRESDIPEFRDTDFSGTPSLSEIKKASLINHFLIGSAFLSVITLLLTTWITVSYFTSKNEPQPPVLVKQQPNNNSAVLAATNTSPFLEINSDTQINGLLSVRDSINGLTLEATPSAGTMTLNAGTTTLTVTKDALLDQDVSTTATPGFNTLNLSATKDQLVFQSGAAGGTLTWTPTAARTITLPDTTDTLVGKATTDTLTNKSISGSSNTLTNIPNSALTNNKVTVTAGTNLTGGGDITLGSSATIALKDSPSVSGSFTIAGVVSLADGTAAAPALTFTSDTNTGLYRIGADKIGLITGGSATSGITIDSSGNVGIGTITPSYQLETTGNVGVGKSLTVTSAGIFSSTGTFANTLTASNGLTLTTGALSLTSTSGQTNLALSSNTNAFTINGLFGIDTTNNRVGIGTTNPQVALQVLGGNVGIGTSAAGAALQVNGGGLFGWGTASVAGPSNGLGVSGNVGIGTTTASSNLTVVGNAMISQTWSGISVPTSGLFVEGNVGIGATTSSNKLDVWGNSRLAGTLTVDSTSSFGGNLTLNSGQFLAPNGTFSLPSYSFTNSTSTGIYSPSSNALALNTNGASTPPLTITAAGNVGIGVTAPTQLFQVNPTGPNSIVITSAGNVGIGTTSPAANLHVTGTSKFDGISTHGNVLPDADITYDLGSAAVRWNNAYVYTLTATNIAGVVTGGSTTSSDWMINANNALDSANSTVTFKRGSPTNAVLQWYGNNNTFDFNSGIRIGVNNGSASTIESTTGLVLSGFANDITTGTNEHLSLIPNGTGNVGIGTSSPGALLGVLGGVNIGGGSSRFAEKGGPANGLAVEGNVGIGTTSPLAPLHVWGNNTNSAFFLNGNVGIGTISPTSGLNIYGTSEAASQLTIQRLDGTARSLILTPASSSLYASMTTSSTLGLLFNTAGYQELYLNGSGNVGIGTTNPSYQLQTTGNVGIGGSLTVTSAATFSSTGTFTSTLTASNGLTLTTGALNLTSTSGQANLALSSNTNAFTINGLFGIDTTNNRVGIGTTAPQVALQVLGGNVGIGTSAAGAALQVNGGGLFGWGTASIAGPSNGLAISGNVGIGTTSFTSGLSGLQIQPAARTKTALLVTDSDGSSSFEINLGSGGQSTIYQRDAEGVIVNVFGTGGASYITGGNVGIGFTSPNALLHINGANQTTAAYGIQMGSDITLYRSAANTLKTDNNLVVGGTITGSGTQFLAANGTASLPSYSFSNLTNAGLWTNGDGLLLTTGGTNTKGIAVTGAGNVGIGVTNPVGALQVNGAAAIGYGSIPTSSLPSNGLAVSGNVGIGTTTPLAPLHVWGNNTDSAFFLNGNVGIGTISPTSGLNVYGTSQAASQLTIQRFDGAARSLTLTPASGSLYASMTTSSTQGLLFNTTGYQELYLNGSGNVGIGTTNPSYQLQTTGNVGIGGSLTVTSAANFSSTGSFTSTLTASNGLTLTTGALNLTSTSGQANLALTNNTNAFTINGLFGIDTTNNRVGIGTTAPQVALQVLGGNVGIGTSAAGAALQVNGGGLFGWGTAAVAGPANGLAVSGNVGIGTTSPGDLLHVRNTSGAANLRLEGNSGNPGVMFYVGSTLKAQIYEESGDNTLRLGTGTGAQTDLVIGGGGNVGIGTASPGSALTVIGNVGIGTSAAGAALQVNGGGLIGWGTASVAGPANGLAVSGNIGIGTTSPLAPLHVWGNNTDSAFFLNGNVGIGTISPSAQLDIGTNVAFTGNRLRLLGYATTAGTDANLEIADGTGGVYWKFARANNNTFRMDLSATLGIMGGNVGIGTTSPTYQLQTTGNVGIGGSLTVTSGTVLSGGLAVSGGSVVLPSGSIQNSELENSSITVNATAGTGLSVSGSPVSLGGTLTIAGIDASTTVKGVASFNSTNFSVSSGAVNTIQDIATSATPTFVGLNTTSGNVGIGTSATGVRLAVNGTGLFGWGTASVAGPSNGLAVSGNVGIGTTTATHNLEVIGTANFTGNVGVGNSLTTTGLTVANGGLNVTGLANLTGNVGIGGSLTVLSGLSLPQSSILNSYLVNSSINVSATAGTGLSVSGSPVSLGGTLTIAGIDASTTVKGVASFNSTNFSVSSGAVNTIQDIATSATPTFVGLNTTSGNVGIGFTSPNVVLQVASAPSSASSLANILGANGSQLSLTGSTATTLQSKLALGIDTTNNFGYIQAGNIAGTATAYNLALEPKGGNVGIGTSAPSYPLDVLGNTSIPGSGYTIPARIMGPSSNGNAFPFVEATSTAYWWLRTTSKAHSWMIGAEDDGTDSVFEIARVTNGGGLVSELGSRSRSFIIDYTSQNLGIGLDWATLPAAKLQVAGNAMIGYSSGTPGSLSNGLAVSGNVGIGTTSPTVTLEAVCTNNCDWQFTRSGSGVLRGSAGSTPAFGTNSAHSLSIKTNWTDAMVIDTSQNIGIGMSAPDRLLHIARTIDITPTNAGLMGVSGTQFDISGATTNAAKKLVLGIDTTDNYGIIQAGNTDGTNYALSLNPAGGNVGIGTTSPLAALDIRNAMSIGTAGSNEGTITFRTTGAGETAPTIAASAGNLVLTTATGWVNLAADNGIQVTGNGNNIWWTANSGNATFDFYGGSATTLSIKNTNQGTVNLSLPKGNIGIGTSATGAALQVNGGGLFGWGTAATSLSSGAIAAFNGNVGIGTTSPTYQLQTTGNVGIGGSLTVSSVLQATKLVSCNTIDTDASGVFVCGTDAGASQQTFTANGTWTKPSGAIIAIVEAVGAGGGGGGGPGAAAGNSRAGGGGGGGGAIVKQVFQTSALGATESVTVGAGGTAGTAGSSADGTAGGNGGNSSFGSYVTAYGGGSGQEGASGYSTRLGGGGGGSAGAGNQNGNQGYGGAPNSGSSTELNVGGMGGDSYAGSGENAEFGGGAGGGVSSTNQGGAGGGSVFSSPGGGGGGGVNSSNVEGGGGAGGAYQNYANGSVVPGGAGGAVNGGAGTAGTSRNYGAGDGGGGGGGQDSGTGGAGAAGGAPGGGGGGGAGGTTVGGAGGAGGRGEVRVWTVTGGTGADLAEVYFSLDFSLEGGDVVVADQDLPGIGFKKSSKAYDGTVLGIVSTQPGLVLGDDSKPDKNAKPVQLALAGRVPVKVSTENGPISVGDYLTSSSIPGVAMKATKAGPTVGKALEAFSCNTSGVGFDSPEVDCQGKVMAFVNVSWFDPDALRDNLSDISINLLDGASFNLSPSKLYTVSSSLSGAIGRVGAFDQLALGSLTAGNISTDSLNVNHITVQGQDLTEILSSKVGLDSFEMSTASSSAQLTAGDVVTTSGDSFEVSQEPYDKNILGVSTSDEPPNNILLSGKTSVRVSTENGPIQVGDFLTSSSTPGVAMKATRPGTVVGKALESYDNPDPHQVGTILIFVNVTFADPGNFLASLSLDEEGNMIIPKIRTSSLQIGPISQIGQIGTDGTQITTNSDPDYTSPGPNLASNTNSYIDLSGEIASLEDKIKSLESRIEELAQNTSGNVGIGTTAQVTGNRQQATESAQVATDSATVAYSLPPVASDLNLTPPDILYNTGSATFTNLTVKSEATMSGQLVAYDLSVSNSFKSLGKTSLADTSIAGTLSVDGTLSIEQGKEINVLGTLYLQKTALASGIDIFNGKITIDPAGNITTQGKIIAGEVKTNKLTISNTPVATSSATLAASIGTATLPANTTSVTIQTSQAYDSAKVFITPITNTDKTLSVTNIKNNESFDVSVLTPSTADINFNWWIVQTN